MSREQIYNAVFVAGSTATGFNAKSRRLRHIEDLQPSEFPAFFQVQDDESWQHGNNMGNLPPIGEYHVEWWIYTFEPDPNLPPATRLNNALDAVTAALALPPAAPGFKQSLGGLVESVQLSGAISIAEGVLGDRAVARIPLVIKLKS